MTAPLAVVTGAASGIGLALTEELSARSVDVIAIDRDPPPFADRRGVTAICADVSDAEAMAQIAADHSDRPLRYLFANAGVGAPGSASGATLDDWQRAWEINTLGPLITLRSWWPQLISARGKAVVTVSAAALMTYPGAALYRATKSALLSMLENLYYETRDSGVSLHALCPGIVQSNIVANALRSNGSNQAPDPFTAFLQESMRTAEPAAAFAGRVLDGLEGSPPFYWLTHPDTLPGIERSFGAIMTDGHPPLEFGAMQ